MRKFLVSMVVILVLLVAALLVAPRFIDVNRYHDRITAELEQRLNRPVSLGEMRLSLLPPTFYVANAVIGEDGAFSTGKPFAQAQELDVSIKLLPLLRKRLEIRSVQLNHPSVELVRNQQGAWNFASLANRTVNGSTTAPKAESKPANQQQSFELGQLKISDGSVAVTDLEKHQSRAVYDHIDVTVKDYAQGKPFSLLVAAHLPGEGGQSVRLEGRGGPIDDAGMVNTPVDGVLKLNGVSISSVEQFLNSPALAGSDATVSGEASVSNHAGQLASKGSLRFDNARVRNVDVGYPIAMDYEVSDDLNSDVVRLMHATLKLGNTPLSLSGSVNTRNTPALADLFVQASHVSIAEAARLASAFGVAFQPGMQITGNLTANVHVQGAATSPSLNGSVSGRNLAFSSKQFPAPVKVDDLELALSPQTIRSNNFTVASGGTAVNLQLGVEQYTTANPQVEATVKTANANLGELLNIAQSAGVASLNGMNGSGVLSLDMHAVGPLKDANAMNLTGSGKISDASLRAPSMTAPLKIGNASLQFTQNSVVVQDLAAVLGSSNFTGNLTLRNFQAPQVQFALAADKLDILELQKIFGAASPAAPRQTAALGAVSVAFAAEPAAAPGILTRTTGRGTVTIGTLAYDQLVLQNVRSNVTLDQGLVRLDPLTSQLYNGTETGSIIADLRPAQPQFTVNLKMQKVDSNQLLASVSNLKDTLYGLLASGAQLSFASVPAGSDIAKTLNGHLTLNLANGKLTKVNMLQQIAGIGKFQSLGQSAENVTNIQQLSGDFDIRNGVATTNNLKAAVEGGTLAAAGAVNLVDQSLNMRATAVLSKAMSQSVGGASIGGFMQTALANKNGELVMPLLITGTFQNMHFAPDMQQMAQMKVSHLLPSFANPAQMTSGVLGSVTGQGGKGQGGIGGIVGGLVGGQDQKSNQQGNSVAQPASPQQPQQGVGGALNGIFGGKKNSQ